MQFYQACRHTKHILFSKSVARVGNWQSSLWCIYDAMTVTSWLLPEWNKNTWLSRTWLKKYVFFSFNNNCPQFNCLIVLLSPTGAKHYTWLSWPQLKEHVFFSFKNNCPHFNCYNITQPHSSQTLHVIILASLGERYITFQSLSTLFFAFVFVCWFVCLFFWGVGFACFPNEATRSILHFLSGTLSAFQTSPPNH